MKIMMNDMIRYASLMAGLLLLCSCSLLSPVKSEPQNVYVINAVPKYLPLRHTHPITMLVMQPETDPIYNSPNMAYTNKPYQIAYFAQNRWAESPAQMLQPLIVQTLQNTHFFQAIVTPPFVGIYDYVLSTQILQLQQDFTQRPAILRLRVRAQLTRSATNQLIATKQFTIAEPIRIKTPYGGVIAANQAAEKLQRELAEFVTTKKYE